MQKNAYVPKLVQVMKLTAILLTVAFVHVCTAGASQSISLSGKNLPLKTVFAAIKQQTGYAVFSNRDDLAGTKPVTLAVRDVPLSDFMHLVLKDQPLDFIIEGKTIILSRKATAPPSSTTPPTQLGQPISGQVIDADGKPIPGVTIRIKNSKNGAATDEQGRFSLTDVEEGNTLEVTAIGYAPLSLQFVNDIFVVISNGVASELNSKLLNASLSALLIQLTGKTAALNEVVVNKGYYTEKKTLSLGNVSTVNAEDIARQPIADPMRALKGLVAGLFIQQANGISGTTATIRIRGQNSMRGSNEPLYIIDGMPFVPSYFNSFPVLGSTTLSPLASLNTADIENISVLKDADATAIYGSRGANGVILITTKKGKAGAASIDASVYTGWGTPTSRLKLLNNQQYLQMRHEAFLNDGTSPNPAIDYDLTRWDTTRYTDWQKLLIPHTMRTTDAQLSLSGGNTNNKFLIGGNYHRETPVTYGDGYNQTASVHLSVNNQAYAGRLKTQLSASYVSNSTRGQAASPMFTLAPDAPAVYDANGKLNWENATWTNPLGAMQQYGVTQSGNLNGALDMRYEIFKGLEIGGNAGYNTMHVNNSNVAPPSTFNPAVATQSARLGLMTYAIWSWNLEPQLTYRRNFGKADVNFLAGGTWNNRTQTTNQQTGTGYANDALINNIAAATTITTQYFNVLYRYTSIYGRLGFNWDEKYLLNLTARRDGSARFGPGKQFGNFGSVGAGWIFTKDAWVKKNIPWLSFGKLRTSYGTSGNEPGSDYQYLSLYNNFFSPYQSATTLYPTGLYNADYAWEVNKKFEAGMEVGILKDRVMATASYYRNRSSNQLLQYTLSAVTGFSGITQNLPATVQNTGWEFTLNTQNVRSTNVEWTSSFNLTIPSNKLVAFPNLGASSYSSTYIVGEPLAIRLLYHYTGVDSQTGLYTFQDYNKDGVISSPDDRKSIVFSGQQFYGGLQNHIRYKGLSLDFLFQFVRQKQIPNYFGSLSYVPGTMNNQPDYVMNRWSKPGDISDVQKFTNSNAVALRAYSNNMSSDHAFSDASYIRLQNVALSYQLPTSWKEKAHIGNGRVYLQAENLLTITDYFGLDPETQNSFYPPLRIITIGIQVSL